MCLEMYALPFWKKKFSRICALMFVNLYAYDLMMISVCMSRFMFACVPTAHMCYT